MALITWEKGRSTYTKKVGYKKVDRWKLKRKQEKKGNDKSKGTNQPCAICVYGR